jgi:hypothetical protein
MKRKMVICLMTAVLVALNSCSMGKKPTPTQYQSDTNLAENLLNNSLIDSTNLQNYVDPHTDDAIILEMILDYNEESDKAKFSENNGKIINSPELRAKIIKLSNNL